MVCENCEDCGGDVLEDMPHMTININIKYIDNRLNKDESTYVDEVVMLDGEEE